jgi:hypothetical protein
LIVISAVLAGLAFGITCYVKRKKAIVQITSLFGSFVLFYGFGYFLNLLDNMLDLFEKTKAGQQLVL